MIRQAASCSIFVLLFVAAAAAISAQTIEILPAVDTSDETDPGAFFTKAFFVSNRGSLQDKYATALTLPPGWRVIALDSAPVIPLKSGDTVFATVYVPANTAADTYSLIMRVNDREAGTEVAAFEFDVDVRKKPGFELLAVDAPDYVLAGEVYQSIFALRNTGNVALSLGVTVSARPDLDFVSEINRAEVATGAARVFAVSVRTDQSHSGRFNHVLKVTATADAAGLEPRSVASSVEILPRISGEEKPYRTLPVGVAVRQELRHADTDTYGFRASLNAEGPLSESGDDMFSGYLKVPFDREGALFNEKSEIAISYTNEPFDLFLGNTFFSVSRLTEDSIYGTGARVNYSADGFLIGGYHTETGLSPPSVSQTALWYGQDLGDTANVRVNLVDSINRVGPGTIDFLSSVELSKTGGAGPSTVFEYAADAFHNADVAYYLALNDSLPGLMYSLETYKADPGFSGGLKDVESYSVRLAIPLGTSVAVSAGFRNSYSALDQPVPDLMESRNVGLRWRINPDSSIGFSYTHASDVTVARDKSLSVEGIRVDFSHAVGKLKAEVAARLSRSFDKPADDRSMKELYSGSFFCRLDERQSLKGHTSVSVTRGSESSEILTFGVDYSADLNEKTGLKLAYRSSSKTGSYYAGQDSLRASVVHRIAEGQTAMLQGSYAPNRSLDRFTDFTMSIEYHASFGLPIGLRKVGKIAGIVKDVETGRGVPDVIVRIGDRVAITDLSGRFLFLSMPPGPYTVGVDLSRLKESRIVLGTPPIKVDVKPGETSEVEILLIEPGVITGTVKRFSRDLEGKLTDVGGYQNLLVEIIGEHRKLRAVTDRNGNFRVTGLAPGEWVVTIASSQLSDDTYLETDKPYINLSPGGREEVFLSVYPVRREIKMIDEGTILGGGNNRTEGAGVPAEE